MDRKLSLGFKYSWWNVNYMSDIWQKFSGHALHPKDLHFSHEEVEVNKESHWTNNEHGFITGFPLTLHNSELLSQRSRKTRPRMNMFYYLWVQETIQELKHTESALMEGFKYAGEVNMVSHGNKNKPFRWP